MVKSFMTALALVAVVGTVASADKLEVGSKAPGFKATTTDGKDISLDSFKDAKAIVVCFTCNNCPVAVAYEDRFIEFTKEYEAKGVKFVAINVNYTENLPAMKGRAEEKGFNFPYAFDESGVSAKEYGALVTPHLFLLDGERKVAYVGAFDNSQAKPTKHYLADAVDAVLSGKTPSVPTSRPVGCGIKRKR